jgi:predicted nucleic acid-binding protein
MSDIVVDSSVISKWFVPEPDSAHAQRVMTETVAAGGRLVVQDLIYVEVTNVIWKKYRQKRITADEARGSLADLIRSPLHTGQATRVLGPALEIAMQYDRAVYDALFVALARDLGLKGVTADEPLYNTTHADFPEIILLRDWP